MAESGNAFDYQNPKRAVTTPDDPQGLATGLPYPRHLHKFVPLDKKGEPTKDDAVIVAWVGKVPIYNEFRSVVSAADEAAARDDGYSAAPVLKTSEK